VKTRLVPTSKSKLSGAGENTASWLLLAPFMAFFVLCTLIPVGSSVVLSFFDYDMVSTPIFTGLQNYMRMFTDDSVFFTVLGNTLKFAVVTGPLSFLLSFLLAWLINEFPHTVRSILSFLFYAPALVGNAYYIWQVAFSGDSYGWLNAWLTKLGFIDTPVQWLKDTSYIMPICIMVALWGSLGMTFLSFIAGLQGIDRSLYEAGSIDGISNRWQEVWYITLPSMKPQLMFGAVMSITGAFNFGSIVTTLCGNPPTDYVGYTVTHHIEEYGNVRWEVGYSSALTFLMFLIMIGANLLINKLISKVGQ